MIRLNIVDEFPKTGVPFWVHRLEKDEMVEIVILSQRFLKIMTHWDPAHGKHGRSECCTLPTSECAGHLRNLPLRGKAYLHVYNYVKKEQEFLELPPAAMADVLRFCEHAKSLRGFRLGLRRGAKKTARIFCEMRTPYDRISDQPLPPELSPWISLCPLWRMKISDLARVDQPDFELLAS